MGTPAPVFQLTLICGNADRLCPPPPIILLPGEIMHVEGDYGSGLDGFLEHVTGIRACNPGAKFLDGRDVSLASPETLHGLGMRYVSGRRKLISGLTVEEHLRLRLMSGSKGTSLQDAKHQIVKWLPALTTLFGVLAANLSGGQQQLAMLAIAAVGTPRVVVFDEPFMGLAPAIRPSVERLFHVLQEGGSALIIAEQRATIGENSVVRKYVIRA